MFGPEEAGQAGRLRRAPSARVPLLLLAPALLLTAVLFGGGLILGALQALGHAPGTGLGNVTLEHFRSAILNPDFAASLWLTLYVAGASTAVAAALGTALALALHDAADKSRLFRFIHQIPLAVPHLVVAAGVLFLLSPSGLAARIDHALGASAALGSALSWLGLAGPGGFPELTNDRYSAGVIVAYVWKEIPFIAVMVLASLRNSGTELVEVGKTLNASWRQRFIHITLPVILPSLGAASLIAFAYSFGAYEVPYLLGRTHPAMLPVTAYKLYSDVDLLARPEGIATGLAIAAAAALAVLLSQAAARAARRRGAAI